MQSRKNSTRYLRYLKCVLAVVLLACGLQSTRVGAQSSTNKGSDWPALKLVWQTEFKGDSVIPSPGDIAIDKWGNVYISTQSSNQIKKFDKDGKFITKWGENGKGEGKFNLALGVGLDADANVYITDFYNRLIQKFDTNGKFLQQWATEPSTSPAFIDVDWQGNIYIDQFPPHDEHFIAKYDKTGKLVMEYGIKDDKKLFAGRIEDIAVDADGNLYVCDAFVNRIQKISPEGKLLATFGDKATPEGKGKFYVPVSITIDAEGNMYVVDNYWLQKLDAKGNFIAQWSIQEGDLLGSNNIRVDSEGNIYTFAKSEVPSVVGGTIKAFLLKKFSQSNMKMD